MTLIKPSTILTPLVLRGDSYSQAALHSRIIILEMKAHLLPATLPRTHGVVGGSGGAQQGLLQGHSLPEHPEPRRVSLDKRCSPFPTEPSQPRSYAPFLLRTPQVSTDGGSLLSLPTQDIHTPFDFKMLWGEFLCVWAGRRAAGEGVPPSFLFAQTLQ